VQAHYQQQLQQQLQQFLQAATSTLPDVAFETALADPDSDLAGSVLVKLTSFSNLPDSSAPAEERARFQRRMVSAWQDATALAAGLLSSSAGSGAAAAAVELPRLCLVHMSGSCSTRLALCRRRTASKLLRRSGKVGDAAVHAVAVLKLLRMQQQQAGCRLCMLSNTVWHKRMQWWCVRKRG
jgi:hypothetical protein